MTRRFSLRQIPSYGLYGEPSLSARYEDGLHVEDIPARSSKYLWQIGSHRHIGLSQCVFVASGPASAEIEGRRTGFRGPIAFVIPSGTIHGFKFGADSRGYVLSVNLETLLDMAGPAHIGPIVELFAAPRAMNLEAGSDRALAARVAEMFAILMKEFARPAAGPITGWLACTILWTLAGGLACDQIPSIDRQVYERFRRFRLLVEAHFHEHWPARRYAKHLALSESSLNRLCRELAGGTAFDVLQRRLLLEARRRLRYAGGTVAVIARQLGFGDTAYFCRFFRRHVGMSPSEFRRQSDAAAR